MEKMIMAVVATAVIMIVMGPVIFMGYSVADPFFQKMGGEEHDSIGGVSGNDAISFGPALFFAGGSVLAAPVAVGLYLYLGGRRRSGNPPRGRV